VRVYVAQVATALAAIHANKVVHANLSTQNILIDDNDSLKIVSYSAPDLCEDWLWERPAIQ